MFFVNVTDPWVLVISVFVIICLIYLGKEAKNAYIPLIALVVFLILLVLHGIQYMTLPLQFEELAPLLGRCLLIDFVMIFVTYISYLWIDDIEAKEKKKKSINNSLEWFWKKV